MCFSTHANTPSKLQENLSQTCTQQSSNFHVAGFLTLLFLYRHECKRCFPIHYLSVSCRPPDVHVRGFSWFIYCRPSRAVPTSDFLYYCSKQGHCFFLFSFFKTKLCARCIAMVREYSRHCLLLCDQGCCKSFKPHLIGRTTLGVQHFATYLHSSNGLLNTLEMGCFSISLLSFFFFSSPWYTVVHLLRYLMLSAKGSASMFTIHVPAWQSTLLNLCKSRVCACAE